METDSVFIIITLFLWTIFGQFSLHFNTDMLHNIRSNPYFVHIFGILCAIFLFHSPDVPLVDIFFQSIVLYFSFLFLAKCRWPFMAVALILLIIHDLIRRRIQRKDEEKEIILDENERRLQIIALQFLKAMVFIIIVVGLIDLSRRKMKSKTENFSWIKLFFGVREKFVFRSNNNTL